jgi:hypothetical protein
MFGNDDKSGITAWADAIKSNTAITDFNLAKNCLDGNDAKILGPAISGNKAMTSLNLSDNELNAEAAKHIAEGIKVSTCVVKVVLIHVYVLLATG